MTPPDFNVAFDVAFDLDRLTAELRAARGALLALAREASESRVYRATPRAGWTLRHELSALAAADRELLHVLGELRRRPAPLALDLRRRYGETMHALQRLRLRSLLDGLESDGQRVVAALREHERVLGRPLALAGREIAPAADYVRAYAERSQRALQTLRRSLSA